MKLDRFYDVSDWASSLGGCVYIELETSLFDYVPLFFCIASERPYAMIEVVEFLLEFRLMHI